MKKSIFVVLLLFFASISNATSLKLDGWNLMSICQDINGSSIDMTNIQQIQSQDGKFLFSGSKAKYSTLKELKAGYGYWVKGDAGTQFDTREVNKKLEMPLKLDGWNLMGMCEDLVALDMNMTNFQQIQSQDGKFLFSGSKAKYSTLKNFENGYGYWVKGNTGTPFISKNGLSIPFGYDFRVIDHLGIVIEGAYKNYTVKFYSDYNASIDQQKINKPVLVTINGDELPLLNIHQEYKSRNIVVAIYDSNDQLIDLTEPLLVVNDDDIMYINMTLNIDEDSINDLVSGIVQFKDENGSDISAPNDAFIGLVPSVFQNDASSWNRLICKIDVNGSYGTECYIHFDEAGMRDAFANPDETFQTVVFKNHIEPEAYNFNCGEDVYRWVGENEPFENLASIVVYPNDFQAGDATGCVPPPSEQYRFNVINNSGMIIQTTMNVEGVSYFVKLFADYEDTQDDRKNHKGVVVRLNGVDSPTMQIQETYVGHSIVAAVYNSANELLASSAATTVDGTVPVTIITVTH